MNADAAFSVIGDATWLVLNGLFIGKPFGFLFLLDSCKPLNFGMQKDDYDIFVLGMVGIGFSFIICSYSCI